MLLPHIIVWFHYHPEQPPGFQIPKRWVAPDSFFLFLTRLWDEEVLYFALPYTDRWSFPHHVLDFEIWVSIELVLAVYLFKFNMVLFFVVHNDFFAAARAFIIVESIIFMRAWLLITVRKVNDPFFLPDFVLSVLLQKLDCILWPYRVMLPNRLVEIIRKEILFGLKALRDRLRLWRSDLRNWHLRWTRKNQFLSLHRWVPIKVLRCLSSFDIRWKVRSHLLQWPTILSVLWVEVFEIDITFLLIAFFHLLSFHALNLRAGFLIRKQRLIHHFYVIFFKRHVIVLF